jgi:PilZ domain
VHALQTLAVARFGICGWEVGRHAIEGFSRLSVSSSGVAVVTPAPFTPGKEVEIVLLLHGAELTVRASGTMVWDDKHGKAGITFRCLVPKMQTELDSWLAAHFVELLSSGAWC